MFRCTACGSLNRVPAWKRGDGPSCGNCKQALDVTGAPQEVTAEGLARAVASSEVPVLVDFWAPWCGPCKVAGPQLDQLARSRPGELIALKLNTDQEPWPSAAYSIRGIPTFLLFQNGNEVARKSGAMSKAMMAQWIDSVIKPGAGPPAIA